MSDSPCSHYFHHFCSHLRHTYFFHVSFLYCISSLWPSIFIGSWIFQLSHLFSLQTSFLLNSSVSSSCLTFLSVLCLSRRFVKSKSKGAISLSICIWTLVAVLSQNQTQCLLTCPAPPRSRCVLSVWQEAPSEASHVRGKVKKKWRYNGSLSRHPLCLPPLVIQTPSTRRPGAFTSTLSLFELPNWVCASALQVKQLPDFAELAHNQKSGV